MNSRIKMALSFRKLQMQNAGFNFLLAGDIHLISYFCFTIILANVNCPSDYLSEINITVKGNGRQQILSDDSGWCGNYASGVFNSLPNEIFVNGVLQNTSCKYVDNLVNQTNIITMR